MLTYPNTADRTFAPRGRTPTCTSLPPDVTELQEDDRGQQGEQEERNGRALSEVAAAQALLIGQRGEEVRGVDGAAAGEHLHDVEVGEREDGGEEDDHGQHRFEQ